MAFRALTLIALVLGLAYPKIGYGQDSCIKRHSDTVWKPINARHLVEDVRFAQSPNSYKGLIAKLGNPFARRTHRKEAVWLYGSRRKSVTRYCGGVIKVDHTSEYYLLTIRINGGRSIGCSVVRKTHITSTEKPDPFGDEGLLPFTYSSMPCDSWLKSEAERAAP